MTMDSNFGPSLHYVDLDHALSDQNFWDEKIVKTSPY